MDISKLFNTDLPAWLAANADSAKRVGGRYAFNITGDGGGKWFLDLSSTGPKIEPASDQRADCTITLSTADFETLWGNLYAGESLYYSGRVYISGDEMVALQLRDFLMRAKSAIG
jgi:hypothetical protein